MAPEVRAILVTEGISDAPLTTTLEQLCVRAGAREATVRWVDFDRLGLRPGHSVSDKVSSAVSAFPDVALVFVHRDADRPSAEPRLSEIREALASLPLPLHVAVVPVQETEAWLLVSGEAAIRAAAGQPRGRLALDLPGPRSVEGMARPKELLERVVEQAQQGLSRRHRVPFGSVRRLLLERLDLDGPIREVPSFVRLCDDIHIAIERLSR